MRNVRNNDATHTDQLSPVSVIETDGVTFITGIRALSFGGESSLALRDSSEVVAWGYGSYGQIGNSTTPTVTNFPVAVLNEDGSSNLSGVEMIQSGELHHVALLNDGTLLTWGYNGFGQLGSGNTTQSSLPQPVLIDDVTPLTNITNIATGKMAHFNLAQDRWGRVWSWGRNNQGQLGNGTTQNSRYAQLVMDSSGYPVTDVVALAAGIDFSMALRRDGSVLSWGNNSNGQLGNANSGVDELYPVEVLDSSGSLPLSGVTAISASNYSSLARLTDASLLSWGRDSNGQLGNGGSNSDSSLPTTVLDSDGLSAVAGVSLITSGSQHHMLMKQDGSLYSWGYNGYGQLGVGSTTPSFDYPQSVNLTP